MPSRTLRRRLANVEDAHAAVNAAAWAQLDDLLHAEVGAACEVETPRWDAWVAALSDDEHEREDARLTAAAKAVCARHAPGMRPHVEALATWAEAAAEVMATDGIPPRGIAPPPYVPTPAEARALNELAVGCPDGPDAPREHVAAVILGICATLARAVGRWHAGERLPVQ
jgi:hypothetical protein